MKSRRSVAGAVLGSAAMCFISSSQASVLGLDLNSDFNPNAYVVERTDAFTVGYKFSLSAATQVNGLGFWDEGDGYQDTTVGLWDSTGKLLGSTSSATASVTSFNANVLGTWNFMDFNLKLGPGTYVVGSWGDDMEYLYTLVPGALTANDLKFLSSREKRGDGFQYPSDELCTACMGFLGGNVRFGDPNVVQEPGTLALLGLSLAGLGVLRRRRKT